MNKKVIIALMSIFLLVFTSCKSREEKVIDRLTSLYENIDKNGSKFDQQQWQEAIEEYKDIHDQMLDCDFTKEQMKEIGLLEAKIFAAISENGSKALVGQFTGVLQQLSGFLNGFIQGLDENQDEIEQAVGQIGDAVDKISNLFGK